MLAFHNEFVMKTKLLLLAVACLLLLTATGYAQIQTVMTTIPQDGVMHERALEAQMKKGVRMFWDGQSTGLMAMVIIENHEFRAALGVSDEQLEQFRNRLDMGNIMRDLHDTPEFQEIQQAAMELAQPALELADPSLYVFDEETMSKALELQGRAETLTMNAMIDATTNALTPELTQKIHEMHLAAMGELPIISARAFEALDLTDTQRQEMERIKQRFEPDFEILLEEYVRNQMILDRKIDSEIDKISQYIQDALDSGVVFPDGTVFSTRREIIQRLLAEDPEYRRLHSEIQSRGNAFSTQFKTQMFDVLTDAQWIRLQDLIDNPPEHVRFFLQRMARELMGTDISVQNENARNGGGRADATNDVWMPGPDSWRPGMPIPESYRIQRNTGNFPRPTNQ